tara:strand:+ start:276 stop:503 length:228 start_codon:yes stop_codon:yes gene_type:complete
MTEEIKTADVEQTYVSTMHSVDLINRIYDSGETLSEEDLEMLQRNKDHLEIMLGKDFWTEAQDLAPLQEALDRTE